MSTSAAATEELPPLLASADGDKTDDDLSGLRVLDLMGFCCRLPTDDATESDELADDGDGDGDGDGAGAGCSSWLDCCTGAGERNLLEATRDLSCDLARAEPLALLWATCAAAAATCAACADWLLPALPLRRS